MREDGEVDRASLLDEVVQERLGHVLHIVQPHVVVEEVVGGPLATVISTSCCTWGIGVFKASDGPY